jgi:hypothetical protein
MNKKVDPREANSNQNEILSLVILIPNRFQEVEYIKI